MSGDPGSTNARPPEAEAPVGSVPTGAVDPAPLGQAGPAAPAVRSPRPEVVPEAAPGVFDLVFRSARLGVDAAALMAGEVADFSLRVARSVLPPAVAERPIDAVDDRLARRRTAARERGEQRVEETKEAASAVLNQVVIGVVDMLDMETLIDHVPVDKVVARVDLPAIIEEVDLGGVVRESTTSLVGEMVDAIRVQVMGIDQFVARVVDRILRRKQPRDLVLDRYDVFGPEIRVPRGLR